MDTLEQLQAENEKLKQEVYLLKLEIEIQIKTHEAQARTLRARYPELEKVEVNGR